MFLPNDLISMILEYNPSHRDMMFASLVEIQGRCVCSQCGKHCIMEICLLPNSRTFCSGLCKSFWIEERIEDIDWDEPEDEIDVLVFGDEYDQFMYEEFVNQMNNYDNEYDSESE